MERKLNTGLCPPGEVTSLVVYSWRNPGRCDDEEALAVSAGEPFLAFEVHSVDG
jgi:hypothetical protein